MKTLLSTLMGALFLLPLTFTHTQAQDEQRPEYVIFTRSHWNMDLDMDDASQKDWLAHEQEYLEKVTKKNEHIWSTSVLRHLYTDDNSEVIFVSVYPTWDAIEKAGAKTQELEAAAWPDRAKRRAFMDGWNKYYVNQHSDEIYATLPGAKIPDERIDSTVVYIQKVYRAYPKDGMASEFEALRLEFAEKVIHKNPYVKAYYPMSHAWGGNSQEMLDVYLVDSVCDVAMMNQSTNELIEKAWPNEEARNAFFDKYDRYFSGKHGDYIYATIPGVSK